MVTITMHLVCSNMYGSREADLVDTTHFHFLAILAPHYRMNPGDLGAMYFTI